jgi:hypothetical protein
MGRGARRSRPHEHCGRPASGARAIGIGVCLAVAAACGAARAAPLPAGDLERRCWQSYTRDRTKINLREPTSVDFSNLQNDQAVRSPFQVDFAIRGMGVAPAGVALAGTGHHHILVNRSLPRSVTDKLPFDDSHRHFGKGQTATLLNLPPGRHTLRLLFADHEHRPYFVFSREVAVQVRGPRDATPRPRIDPARFEASCAAWYQDELTTPRGNEEPLHFTNVRAEEALTSPFNLRMGVDGFGVCAAGGKAEKTGHFVVDVLDAAAGRSVQNFNLSNGATQVNVFIDPGNYRLRLRFVDERGADLLRAHELPVRVVAREAI